MQIGINYAADRLEAALINDINQSGCPYVVVRTILSELLDKVKLLEAQSIQQEREEYEAALKTEEAISSSLQTEDNH